MEFGQKWVHMARYELILKLDGAPWLRIILKPLLTPKGATKIQKLTKKLVFFSRGGHHQVVSEGQTGRESDVGQMSTQSLLIRPSMGKQVRGKLTVLPKRIRQT